MSKKIVVGISDIKIAKGDDELITYALGSCVGICLYDPIMKIGGLSHIMLPTKTSNAALNHPMKFADSAIPLLVKMLEDNGAAKARLKAKIAGGAKMFAVADTNSDIASIGNRNIMAVKATLTQLRIPIIANDTGADFGRTQSFFPATGEMKIKSATKGEWSL